MLTYSAWVFPSHQAVKEQRREDRTKGSFSRELLWQGSVLGLGDYLLSPCLFSPSRFIKSPRGRWTSLCKRRRVSGGRDSPSRRSAHCFWHLTLIDGWMNLMQKWSLEPRSVRFVVLDNNHEEPTFWGSPHCSLGSDKVRLESEFKGLAFMLVCVSQVPSQNHIILQSTTEHGLQIPTGVVPKTCPKPGDLVS